MRYTLAIIIALTTLAACNTKPKESMKDKSLIQLIVLDPGHFHAALVQKQMYKGVDETVHVYAPEGPEVEDYIKRVNAFNNREESPTDWTLKVYRGKDFLERMLDEKPGNLVVLAGNNQRKTEYIEACVKAGLHVYSDKPMAIDTADFYLLKNTFIKARDNRILVYDIMTERYEVTNMLQKALSSQPGIFGELLNGTIEDPAIIKESVHHFYKIVSGIPLVRPAWFFDVKQEGKAIADVGTHLVDLIMLGAGNLSNPFTLREVSILDAETGVTPITREQFRRVTRYEDFPAYLDPYIEDGILMAPANSLLDFKTGDVHAQVSVKWAYEAPEGGGDTHYSIMRGTLSDLIIRQGAEQEYTPELYIKVKSSADAGAVEEALNTFLKQSLKELYPDLSLESSGERTWHLVIPDKYRIGHEAHFAEVTQRFLDYFHLRRIPDWEWQQMLTKYYITTHAAMWDE